MKKILERLALCVFVVAGAPAYADDWQWTLTPYIWAADLGVDVTIRDTQVVDTEIAFDDLLENIEIAAQVHVEAHKGAHGVLFDIFYVALADEQTRPLVPNLPATDARFDSELTMSIVDLAGTYDPAGDEEGVSFKYGVRILDTSFDIDTTFTLGSGAEASRTFSSDDTLVDGLVGIRYRHALTPRLNLLLGADFSTGDTEATWSAGGYLGWALGDSGRYALNLGYRYMDIEFDTGDFVDAHQVLSGVGVGLAISF